MKAENLVILRDKGFNVPKFSVVKEVAEVDLSFSNSSLFAVRSSCEVEDNVNKSYAGQFLTFLDVPRDEVTNAVIDVKSSYKGKKGKVIIQDMIESDYSGVLFTGNPLGILNEIVIVVGRGIGFNVVEDKETVTTYFYNIDDEVYYKEKVGNSVELSKSHLLKLIEIGQNIESIFGCKMDIEYAIKNEEIYILQARPITMLKQSNPIILDNSNIVESYPGVSLPLTQSVVKDIYYTIFKYCVRNIVQDNDVMQNIDEHLKHMVAIANWRLYYCISNWYYILKMLPFSNFIIPVWQEMLGVNNRSIITDTYKFSGKVKWKLACNFLKSMKTVEKDTEDLNSFFEEKYRDCRTNLYVLNTVEDVLQYFENFKDSIISRWYVTLLNDLYAFLFTALAGKEHKDTISNVSELISLEPVKAVNELLKVKQEKGVESAEYKELFEGYITKFGDRCLSELKLETETYRINPSLFSDYLDTQSIVEIPKNITKESKNPFVKRAKRGIYNREMSRLNRTRLFGFVRDVFLYVGKLLVEQGLLNIERDVFYLYYEELGRAEDMKDIVDSRKQMCKQFEKLPTYSRLVFAEKIIDKVSSVNVELLEDKELVGVGISEGIAEGEVVIINQADLSIDTKDKIIVTKITDPGWVFLLRECKGIIAEQGSLLSHTAIIARELKKPAVVNVKNALQMFKTGDRVRINGLTGVVEKVVSANV